MLLPKKLSSKARFLEESGALLKAKPYCIHREYEQRALKQKIVSFLEGESGLGAWR